MSTAWDRQSRISFEICCNSGTLVRPLFRSTIFPACPIIDPPTGGTTTTMAFYSELKRRNVLRVAAAYIVSAWLLIQIAETIFPLFGFDEGPARIVVIVMVIGFLPALILSWIFELTPSGLQKDKDVDRSSLVTSRAD